MILARLISKYENLIVCDLAETYNIYDYRRLPLQRVAVFILGLRENSRLMMELSGQKQSMETILLSGIFDKLSWLSWTKTKDAQKGINQPKSIMSIFHKSEKETTGFDSGGDFMKERNKIISSLKVVE